MDTLLIRRKPATQSLERASSVTHNSLAATQRAHISLIDRRHRWARRLPYRAAVVSANARGRQDVFRPLYKRSHINVLAHPRAKAAEGGL